RLTSPLPTPTLFPYTTLFRSQTQYPSLEHVKTIIGIFGDEMPMHIEMTKFDGRVVFSGLPIVRYSGEERLEEIIEIHEAHGCAVDRKSTRLNSSHVKISYAVF